MPKCQFVTEAYCQDAYVFRETLGYRPAQYYTLHNNLVKVVSDELRMMLSSK